MPQHHPPISFPKAGRRKARRARGDADLLGSGAAALQHQVGNRAVQRALLQRQGGGAPRAGFNPLDPAVIGPAVRAVTERNEAPVRRWLDANTNRLRLLTIDQLVGEVRRNVPEAARLADVEIQGLARDWAAANNVTIPVLVVAAPSGPNVRIPDAVKKAFSIPVDGVDIVNFPGGRLNIAARGATAKLTRGNINVGWTGSLGIDVPIEGFQLAGRVDKNRWELTLSTPGEASMPDLTKLAEVFTRAETAMRGMIAATMRFNKLDKVSEITAAITPHIAPVKEGVKALVDLARAPSVSAGVSLSGPMSGGSPPAGAPANSSPSGITLSATLTIRF